MSSKESLNFFSFAKCTKLQLLAGSILLLLTFLLVIFPDPLFHQRNSTVLYDRNGNLLAASIASDEQWRFPELDSVPIKFEKAILHFEDEYFYFHPGINPVSIGRAAWQNVKSGSVKQGGSTISMQLIRISKNRKGKSFFDKFSEALLALSLELHYSKKSILKLYASHAPFGGNVVGLDAAAWRYFGKNSHELTWAESATLAVLPNSPALIFPGKNSHALKKKRDRLLLKLHSNGFIDELQYNLALEESLPEKPHPLPQHAMHLLQRAVKEYPEKPKLNSTLDKNIQLRVEQILSRGADVRYANGVSHAAILVLDTQSGEVLAYAGNVNYANDRKGGMVDMISAPRSTGSILKPLLFASMLQDGQILTESLVPDIPTQIGGYVPKNYNLTYDGAVKARNAIARSLNIPAVRMLNNYGVGKFHAMLNVLGMSTVQRTPMHYGLSLILGGAEGRLDELCNIYANLSRQLLIDSSFTLKKLKYLNDAVDVNDKVFSKKDATLNNAVVYEMLQAMVLVSRPDEEVSWSEFSSGRRVAWKTGTSFGHRDAWAIGITPGQVVGVWVGNADGSASAALTGIGAAAPLLFSVYHGMPIKSWFKKPVDAYEKVKICGKSGFVSGQFCNDDAAIKDVPVVTRNRKQCIFHKAVFLDKESNERVNATCAEPAEMLVKNYFILPPAIESFYKLKHPDYLPLPGLKLGCSAVDDIKNMEVIYPRDLSEIFIPKNWSGADGFVVFEATHRDPNARIFWSLNGKFIGQTLQMHRISASPPPGEHKLNLIDSDGNSISRTIKVFGKQD
jgi:penicillin-binding protein 1C